jgi:orotate phosphoribosyltransferase
MTIFINESFVSHSGRRLPWKLDLDGFTEDDWNAIAEIIAERYRFGAVYGVPRGGIRLAMALERYIKPHGYQTLIVDDVLTTGRSMEHARAGMDYYPNVFGVVVIARGRCPSWVSAIFTVSDWAQS